MVTSPSRRVRVAVAGCGEIAQIMHIPYLKELDRFFELVAVADVSPSVAQAVAARYHVPRWYTDYRAMLAEERPEAIVVLTSNEYHGPIAIEALKHGCHVLVEKPMCLSPQEGREMVETAKRHDRVLMVAYMKRYDPNYVLGQQMLAELKNRFGRPQFIRVHDFCHHNPTVIADVYDIIRPSDDVPQEAARERRELLNLRLTEALGNNAPDDLKHAYLLLLGLASHDMTVIRGLFGDPSGVDFTRIFRNGQGVGVLSVLDFDGVPCTFEIGGSSRTWMEETVTVWYPKATLSIDFPSPYMKHAETRVILKELTDDGQTVFSERIVSRDEAFRRELLAFYAAVVHGEKPPTDGEQGLRDVELLREIVLKT